MNQSIPKHIQAGQSLGLRMGPAGECFISLEVLNENDKASKKIEFMIDTGFDGYLQLDKKTVSDLDLKISGKDKGRGFDNVEKEVDIVSTKIKILNQEISSFPIVVTENGSFLIGTRLLKDLSEMLVIDYRNRTITLTNEPKVQKKVHKTVNKYARG